MPNEQEITVKVRVPAGERCAACRFREFEMFGSLDTPDVYRCKIYNVVVNYKKCQPCLDACKEEVTCDKCGKTGMVNYTLGSGDGYLVPCKCTTKGDVPRGTIPKV